MPPGSFLGLALSLGIFSVGAGLSGVIVDTGKYGKVKNSNSFMGEQKELKENALGAVYIGFLSSLFSVVVIALMLYGNYKKRPNFYLPYLIITGFQLAIGYIGFIIGSCAFLIASMGVAVVSPIHGLLVFSGTGLDRFHCCRDNLLFLCNSMQILPVNEDGVETRETAKNRAN
ncbi:hypothetical protein M3Y97_01135900 [Aphelenchoides bicaudatus]|nr:hypothetical protein M3Y97_01135900 [Aphelenchoides bicaudatus]